MIPLADLQFKIDLLKLSEVPLQVIIWTALASGLVVVVCGQRQLLLKFIQELARFLKASFLWASAAP